MNPIPDAWVRRKLGDVIAPSKDKADPKELPNQPYVGLEHVEAHTMRLLGHGRGADVESTKSTFRKGDVLYGKLRPYLNKVAQPAFDGICSTDFLVFRESKQLDPDYLAQYLNQAWIADAAAQASRGVQLPRINWEFLAKLPISFPPDKSEQRAMANLLRRIRDRQSNARQHLVAAKRAVDEFRQSVLAIACTGRLTAAWRGDTFEDEGRPSTWEVTSIADLAATIPRAIQSGPFGSNLLHSEFVPTGRLVIGIDNVLDGVFSLGRNHRVSNEKFESLRKYEARPLDVLITVMGTVGRVCTVPADLEPALITKHVYRITVNRALANPAYVALALRGHPTVRDQIRSQERGQTRPGINGKIVKELELTVPPLAEQEEIVRLVDTLLAQAESIEQRLRLAATRVGMVSQAALDVALGNTMKGAAATASAQG